MTSNGPSPSSRSVAQLSPRARLSTTYRTPCAMRRGASSLPPSSVSGERLQAPRSGCSRAGVHGGARVRRDARAGARRAHRAARRAALAIFLTSLSTSSRRRRRARHPRAAPPAGAAASLLDMVCLTLTQKTPGVVGRALGRPQRRQWRQSRRAACVRRRCLCRQGCDERRRWRRRRRHHHRRSSHGSSHSGSHGGDVGARGRRRAPRAARPRATDPGQLRHAWVRASNS